MLQGAGRVSGDWITAWRPVLRVMAAALETVLKRRSPLYSHPPTINKSTNTHTSSLRAQSRPSETRDPPYPAPALHPSIMVGVLQQAKEAVTGVLKKAEGVAHQVRT